MLIAVDLTHKDLGWIFQRIVILREIVSHYLCQEKNRDQQFGTFKEKLERGAAAFLAGFWPALVPVGGQGWG